VRQLVRSAPDLNENGFTDDTVLTVAVAHAILTSADMAESLKKFATEHYSLSYGRRFKHQQKPYKTTIKKSGGCFLANLPIS
jgi:ADP-ribosylglycohydrolase